MSLRDDSQQAKGDGKLSRSLLGLRPGKEPPNLVEAEASVCYGMLVVRFQEVI
ncbi:hypothetical protein [Planctomicrobium sp. SH527]|uniref:hypothetical protein n=1 Tax=Planctomicrobium sp. SH527 TaxID=3448123 RepID=UPI003F5BEF98